MRFILSPEYHQQMLRIQDHSPDCYVRPGEYLHHLYVEGVKYVIVPALVECLAQAEQKKDEDAIRHLTLHKAQFDVLLGEAMKLGDLEGVVLLGDAPPEDEGAGAPRSTGYIPAQPRTVNDTGLSVTFLFDLVLRALYNRGRGTGAD